MKRLCPKDKLRFEGFEGSLCPECEAESLPDLAGVVVAGRYELSSYLGIGGMRAPVYKAIQMSTRRRVAIKLLPIRDEKTVSRFEREARIASKLNHRHITIVHDYGQMDDAHMFLVMEFLEGTSLQDLLKREAQLTVMRSLNVLSMILRGLEHAHNHAVVHRDLKPDNIFLVQQDEELDFAKILDFGIAKHFGEVPVDSGELALETLTQETVLCGTPLYMAPEQITQESFDARIDIYAAGIVLFQLLTGRLPFVGRTSYEILSKHLTEPIPRLSQTRPDLQFPAKLEQLCVKAMSKKPHDRFQSAREMRQAIRAVRRSMGAITADTDNMPMEPVLKAAPLAAVSVGTQPISATEIPTGETPKVRRPRYGLVAGILLLAAAATATAVVMSQTESAGGIESSSKTARRGAQTDSSPSSSSDKGATSTAPTVTSDVAKEKPPAGPVSPPSPDGRPAPPATPPTTSLPSAGAHAGEALANAGQMVSQRPQTARLKIESTPPGGIATVNGRELGMTPVTTELVPGSYNITITTEGHLTYSATVEVTPDDVGNTLMKAVMLAPKPAAVSPPSSPAADEVGTKAQRKTKHSGTNKGAKIRDRKVNRRVDKPKPKSTTSGGKTANTQKATSKGPTGTKKPKEKAGVVTKTKETSSASPPKKKPEEKAPPRKKPKIQILGGSDKPKIKVLK